MVLKLFLLSFLLCAVQSEWFLVKTVDGEVNDQDSRVLETVDEGHDKVNGETGRRRDGTYSLLIRNWL